jgi:hypothetical protein
VLARLVGPTAALAIRQIATVSVSPPTTESVPLSARLSTDCFRVAFPPTSTTTSVEFHGSTFAPGMIPIRTATQRAHRAAPLSLPEHPPEPGKPRQNALLVETPITKHQTGGTGPANTEALHRVHADVATPCAFH